MYDLILASESPRRKRILSDAGFTFDTFPVKVSEIPGKNLNVDNKIIAISREKSQAAWTRLLPMKSKPFILLTADTEVVTNGELLGKPLDLRHGVEMLGRLSGRIHLVKTALCLVESIQGKEVVHVETTEVHFKKLSPIQIEDYVQSGEGRDKAGGYGIQGKGSDLIEKFVGSYDNVVGLPIETFKKILKNEHWVINGLAGQTVADE